jgi:hypothetical protein
MRAAVWYNHVKSSRALAVSVKAVDAELEFDEDVAGGVQLAGVHSRLSHLRSFEGGISPCGVVSGTVQACQIVSGIRNAALRE